MDSNEEIFFKKPFIKNTDEEESNDKIETSDQLPTKEESNAQSVSKTILPEPMTQLTPPEGHYFIDQLKNGVIVGQVVVKSRIVFGRARDCDVILEHPSISRYHAVLLWSPFNDQHFQTGENKESFWYLVDCGSTHGTNCNKTSITAGKLIKLIPNNNVFKFGASTRIFTLRSTLEEDSEEADDIRESDSLNKSKPKTASKDMDSDDCNWGINEDQIEEKTEETADSKSLQAIIAAMKSTGKEGLQTDNSNAYSANPNKCIQQWFEREGYDLDFKCDSIHNKFKCTIDLPIDGQWIPVEGSLLHKKKEAITDVCLKSCQLLDKAELLFPWQQKSQSSKRKQEEDSDSDNDMIDETVSLKRKRKVSESNDNSNVENFETLNKKWTEINEELCKLRVKLANIGLKPDERSDSNQESGDPLDDFMATISRQKYGLSMSDKIEKSNIKMKINVLVKDQQKLEKLIKLAKPSVNLKPIPQSDCTVRPIPQNDSELQPIPSNSVTLNKSESNDEMIDENKKEFEKSVEIDRKEEIKRKTEQIINELKSSSKPKSDSSSKSSKQRLRPQSIVEAIEKEKQLEKKQQKLTFDSDYVDWLPPTNQSGDGKTSLNDKLGY